MSTFSASSAPPARGQLAQLWLTAAGDRRKIGGRGEGSYSRRMGQGKRIPDPLREEMRLLRKAGLTIREISALLAKHYHKPVPVPTVQLNTAAIGRGRKVARRSAPEKAAAQAIVQVYEKRSEWQALARKQSGRLERLLVERTPLKIALEDAQADNERLKNECWRYKNSRDEAHNEINALKQEVDELGCELCDLHYQTIAAQNVSGFLQSWLDRTLVQQGRDEARSGDADRSTLRAHNERIGKLEDELGIHAFYDKGESRLAKLQRELDQTVALTPEDTKMVNDVLSPSS